MIWLNDGLKTNRDKSSGKFRMMDISLYSDNLSDIYSDMLSGIYSGILPDICSGILSGNLSDIF